MFGHCHSSYLKVCMTILQDPIGVCNILFRQLANRDRDGYAAEAAGLPDLTVSIATGLP